MAICGRVDVCGDLVNSWKWNEVEDAALDQLNNARAEKLYLRGLRKYMDYSTGLVGVKRRVSLQGFRELIEERRDRGSVEVEYKPSNHSIRWLLTLLERAGLVERLPKQRRTDPMIFRLPLADTGSFRPNEEPQRNRKGGAAKLSPAVAQVCDDVSRKGTAKEEPHTSGISGTDTVNCKNIYPARESVDNFSEMWSGWQVDQWAIEFLQREYGFCEDFLRLVEAQFRIYWCERGGGANQWGSKFVNHVRYRLERGDKEFVIAARYRQGAGRD